MMFFQPQENERTEKKSRFDELDIVIKSSLVPYLKYPLEQTRLNVRKNAGIKSSKWAY